MMIRVMGVGVLVASLCAFGTARAAGDKVDVCHIPPDDPANAHIINVSTKAAPAHLAHGDSLVPAERDCTVGIGVCTTSGTLQCTGGGMVCDAPVASPPEGPETTCDDGLDNDCDGLADGADSDCETFVPPSACDTGTTGVVDGAPWVVCTADESQAWISSTGYGTYDPAAVCNSLGYDAVGRHGETCGAICGYCDFSTSCQAPGEPFFDGANSPECFNTGTLCFTVTWTCVND